jgi:3-oxoadipate enol-lactonase
MKEENVRSSSGFVEVNGTRLYCETAGSGLPLVLIHGYALDTTMWDDQIGPFSQQYQVIRYDLRGFGKSAVPTGESYAHHEDLKALLEHLGIEQAHILGLSLGGAIAINFALAYPDATQSLIGVDVSALDGYEWPDELRRWFAPIFSAAKAGDMESAKEHWLNTGWFSSARKKPDAVARSRKCVSDYSGWHFHNRDPVRGLVPPANERLEEIGAPTLIIIGELDLPFYNHPIADTLHQRIPNAQKVIMPGVGHMSNMEDPANFNEIVISYLAELGSAT